MCYSAQISADYRKYTRLYGATIDIATFAELFWSRLENDRIKVPKALESTFGSLEDAQAPHIKELISQYQQRQAGKLEQELFKQRKRLADAERSLLSKSTKAALESRRIATAKIEWILTKLGDLRRTDMTDADARIYPGYYAPVLVFENGRRVVKPMRYQCRPAGKPAVYDTKYPGTYNARRDNLEGFWKGQFGHTHGLIVVSAFYEHVVRPHASTDGLSAMGQGEKTVLEFRPRPQQDMLVACLWSHWTGAAEPDLDSFAVIADEPPAEVAAAGHDRCLIPIKPEHMDAWLNPETQSLSELYALLDDRMQPYYEHRLAA